jgi:hypothetical protein
MQTLAEVISCAKRAGLKACRRRPRRTFYPDLKLLLGAVLKGERLPSDVITGTSEGGGRRRDMPDFVLGDWGPSSNGTILLGKDPTPLRRPGWGS